MSKLARIVSILAISCLPAKAADTTVPNIIFILADDLGYGDLGCYGQSQIETPHLDQMAREGLRFTNAYAGGAVCAPSRCVLMTGLHAGHCRIRGNFDATKSPAALRKEDLTIAQVLKQAGYTNGAIGKWGLGEESANTQGLPRRKGFDYFFGYLKHGHAHNYFPDFLWRNESKVSLENTLSSERRGVAGKREEYSHDLLAEEALNFIRQNRQRPFFLYLAFTIPHANNEAGDEGMETPDFGEYHDRDWPAAEKSYAAMISRMDADIGRIVELLREMGINDKTLIVFASDNGPAREGGHDPDFHDSNGPLRGYKGNVTEGGIRIPFIAYWPARIAPGRVCDSPITFADVLPTIASVANTTVSNSADVDGVDFSPTLSGTSQPELHDRFLYWEWNRQGLQQQSSRWRNWKAIRNPRTQTIELFDLQNDPGEVHDLSDKYPEVLRKFKSYFKTARTESEDWPVSVKPHRF